MRVKIHHEGTNILLIMLAVILLINIPLWLYVEALTVSVISTVVCSVLFLLAVNFFRSPRRHFVGDQKNVIVASADGRVVALEEVYENEVLKCRCIQLSVFMSIFNVHANWFPVNGEVISSVHHNGRFQAAYLPKSSTENERSSVLIKADNGSLILVRQIAGAVARRIATYAEKGNEACIEDHMGFIKFGSRVDIYLPLDTEIFVKIGDTTIGGITLIGRLKDNK